MSKRDSNPDDSQTLPKVAQLMVTPPTWDLYEKGNTLGDTGSENGVIIVDEQYGGGVRITLETESPTAPFAITCGIAGWMVHTRYFSSEADARMAYAQMKVELAKIYDRIPDSSEPKAEDSFDDVFKSLHDFIKRFP